MADPRADRLLALQDDPEAVIVFDISDIEDDAFADLISDTTVGYLPVRRGSARDEGVFTLTDIGPSNMVLHPDERRLFVANYNGNSVSVYDLELGTWGQQIGEVSLKERSAGYPRPTHGTLSWPTWRERSTTRLAQLPSPSSTSTKAARPTLRYAHGSPTTDRRAFARARRPDQRDGVPANVSLRHSTVRFSPHLHPEEGGPF